MYADQLNTPRAITNAANTLLWRWDSELFGSAPPNQDADGNGVVFNYHLRFPGQYFDSETGLSYNYFRDYDAGTGRYVQSDPVGLDGGLNTYAYVGNSPLRFVDPYGLQILCKIDKRLCAELLIPVKQLLEERFPEKYSGVNCGLRCGWVPALGVTIFNTITINSKYYKEVERDGNLVSYIGTIAHELRHCKTGFWHPSHFGSSNPDSFSYNPQHGRLDDLALDDALAVLDEAKRRFFQYTCNCPD
ncbi:MAG: RHS repeat-associated core domain-containing protein [Gammaproteobacteria bacterium]